MGKIRRIIASCKKTISALCIVAGIMIAWPFASFYFWAKDRLSMKIHLEPGFHWVYWSKPIERTNGHTLMRDGRLEIHHFVTERRCTFPDCQESRFVSHREELIPQIIHRGFIVEV